MMENIKFEEIRDNIWDMELDALWDCATASSSDYQERCEFFFNILERLVCEGNIRLIHMRTKIPVGGTLDEQMKTYRAAFPKDVKTMGEGMWFFREECPGGALWQTE